MHMRLIRIVRMGLSLGSTVFGGVAPAYPIIRQRAGELGEISGEEVDGLYALSVLLPGPSFLTLYGAVASRVAGVIGALAGQVALLLPGVCLVLLLPLTAAVPYIGAHAAGALQGGIWATCGLMAVTGIESVRKLKTGLQRVLAAIGLVALSLGLHPLLLLAAMLTLGVGRGYLEMRRKAVA